MSKENQGKAKRRLNKVGNRKGLNPNSIKNLQKKGEPSNNPNGRGMGTPNRATVIRKLMDIKVKRKDPEHPRKKIEISLYEAAALGQLLSAERGNTYAWREIQDTLHGVIPTKIQGQFDFSFASLTKQAKDILGGEGDDGTGERDNPNGDQERKQDETKVVGYLADGSEGEGSRNGKANGHWSHPSDSDTDETS